MLKFTVDRAKWARGGKNGDTQLEDRSALLNDANCYCCLGFLALACGGTDEQIRGNDRPDQVPGLKWPSGLIGETTLASGKVLVAATAACTRIISDNDASGYTDEERENRLVHDFASLGVELRFVG